MSAASTQTFSALTIERRVLLTPTRTIAISSIATLSVGTDGQRQPGYAWLALAFLSLAAGYALTFSGIVHGDLALIVKAGAAAMAVLALWLAFRQDRKTYYLLVSTSDGVLTRFTGPDPGVLEEVRRLLSEKINRGDEAAVFTINFANGAIEQLGGGNGGNGRAQGHANGTAANGTAAASGHGQPGYAAGTNGRPGMGDTSRDMSRDPARQLSAQSGNAARLNGAAQAPADAHVDYAKLIPVIVEMHRFYARQPGAEHLEKRLEELELLMRAGASTVSQKSRVQELTRELAQILSAYPQVVQVFTDIRGLAGG